MMAIVFFARIQEKQFNQDAQRTRTTPRPTIYKPSAPLAPSLPSLPKKLTREELRDRSTKDLCWHCNKLWSRNHYCKKKKFSMIEPIKEFEEEALEPKEENTKEDPQPVDCTTHTLANHTNLQAMKVEESLKQKSVTILIKTRSTNNLMNNRVAAQLMLQNEDCSRFDVEVVDGRILKCDRKCSHVKLLLLDQEVNANFFLLPLNDYKVVLNIK
ncbi:hypothetical protein BHE74_00014394 [Ensete ventricosum]|nr:hypothetical protein BHE74_00014394 [Ensete ventricosum]